MNYLENAIARFAKYKLVERWLIVMLVSVVAYMCQSASKTFH